MERPADLPAGRTRYPLWQTLYRIAECYDLNLVADAYRSQRPGPRPPDAAAELSLSEVLDRYIQPASAWTVEGGFLRARDHRWSDHRRLEVPDRLVRQWENRLRTRQVLTLEDLAGLALSLSDLQFPVLEERLRERGISLELWESLRDRGTLPLLRAYGLLSPAQRQALLSGAELPYGRLSPEARQWLAAAHLERQKASFASALPIGGPTQGGLRLRIDSIRREVSADGSGSYRVEYQVADGPDAGKPVTSGTLMELKASAQALQGGQHSFRARLAHTFDPEGSEDFSLMVPWVFVPPVTTAKAQ
jgi:hypothetical protein